MKTKVLTTICAAAFSAGVFAQEAPTIPFLEDVQTERLTEEEAAKQVSADNQQMMDDVETLRRQQMAQLRAAQGNAATVGQDVYAQEQQNSFVQQAKDIYKPSMAFDIEPKKSMVIPVGQGLLNTISTNFTELKVKTSDATSIIETEGGDLYISVGSSNPVGLVLYEAGVRESQISLTLIPIDAPPVIADVTVALTGAMTAKAREYQREMALQEEKETAAQERVAYSSEHTRRLVQILTPVAQGEVPRGFTFSSEVPRDVRQPCRIAIPHKALQRLLGSNEVIDVVAVRNNKDRVYQVREEMCLGNDVLAVGILKKSYLSPGEEMELYIVRDKARLRDKQRINARPRVTLGQGE